MRSAAARLGRRRRRTDFGRLVDRAAVLQHHHQPRSHQRRGFVFSTRHQNATTTTTDLGAEAEELAFAPSKKHHNQTFGKSDAIFMSQFAYRSDVIRAQMWSNDVDTTRGGGGGGGGDDDETIFSQEKECARMLAQIGGTMRAYYKATTGEYDGVVVYSFPKNHDAHAFEQIVKSSGKIEKMYTTKLMTSEDAELALKAAKELVDKYGGGPRHGL
jgi:uncharacterized protein with GYD domain